MLDLFELGYQAIVSLKFVIHHGLYFCLFFSLQQLNCLSEQCHSDCLLCDFSLPGQCFPPIRYKAHSVP